MKYLVLVVSVLLGVTALAYYTLDDDTQPHCNGSEWTNVDGYR